MPARADVKTRRFQTETLPAPDEIVTELHLPAWPASRRWAFQEFARRRGDFALAGILVYYDLDADGRAKNAHTVAGPHALAPESTSSG